MIILDGTVYSFPEFMFLRRFNLHTLNKQSLKNINPSFCHSTSGSMGFVNIQLSS